MRTPAAVALLGAALLVAGCSLLPFPLGPGAISPPIGPVFQLEDGLDVECRGVDERSCLSTADGARRHGDFDATAAIRIIVTCNSDPCTDRQGSASIQMLSKDGSLVDLGTATYWAD